MHRRPVRRQPRVSALVKRGRKWLLLVMDPWEVRAVLVTSDPLALRRLLLQERPGVLATAGLAPSWTPRTVEILRSRRPARLRDLAPYPELRRFTGTAIEPTVRAAVSVAEDALIHSHYAIFAD